VGGELLVPGHVDEAIGLLPEVPGERAQHGRLRDAGEPEQHDGLPPADGAKQQVQLCAAPDHGPGDVVWQSSAHPIPSLRCQDRIIRVHL